MNFQHFVDELMEMASDPKTLDGAIVKYLAKYFSDKALPHLDSHAQVVARCSLIKEGEKIRPERCSYPPSEVLDHVGLQRANFPGEQVFYCAIPSGAEDDHAMFTAIVETVNAKIKDESVEGMDMILSMWVCHRPLKLWVLPFSDASCEVNPTFRDVRKGMEKIIEKAKPGNKEVVEALMFMSDAFWREDNLDVLYRITAAYYHSLKFYEAQRNQTFDGLMYPSCHTKGRGINLVLRKEVIDSKAITLDYYEHGFGRRRKDNPKHIDFKSVTGAIYPNK